jgi:hypothetical protein
MQARPALHSGHHKAPLYSRECLQSISLCAGSACINMGLAMSLIGRLERLILDDNRRVLQRTLQELDQKKESILSEYPGLFSDSGTEGACDVYNDLAQQQVGPCLLELWYSIALAPVNFSEQFFRWYRLLSLLAMLCTAFLNFCCNWPSFTMFWHRPSLHGCRPPC